jgi:hypothetical protein
MWYFSAPLPSSIVCSKWCSLNRVSVRKIVDLSSVGNCISMSGTLNAHPKSLIVRKTIRRFAVGFIP